ncbi:MAG: hypothetical protein HQL62_10900, partial [Magnetococcales bacterium]|nr:hypothetical protein [Magnetococcales bacterium]
EADMAGLDPVLVVILKGGILFGVDLLRAMKQPWPVVFLPRRPPKTPDWITLEDQKLLHGRNLVVVDGILDDGNSLSLLLQRLQFLAPASVRLGVLLHRTVSHALPLPITWVGFEVPHLRVTGYGLDEGERFRYLPKKVSIQHPLKKSSDMKALVRASPRTPPGRCLRPCQGASPLDPDGLPGDE